MHVAEAAGNFKRPNILDLEFRRYVRAVHQRGERVLAELLIEYDADPFDLLAKLKAYAILDSAALHLTGGDRFPPDGGDAA
jgi:hypothetical protein